MKRILITALILLPVLSCSCASFLSGFSIGSMVSGQTARVMPPERKAIIEEAKQETLNEIEHTKENRHRRKSILT
ncbi:MAG TPA: hypothetical protein ENH65_05730 [Candidatus Aminicenantes bacterium]|nr:hypothetical protein [Candidatus Aminicenantes bacterium]